jgi:AcrR family transcriptional regulator
VPALVDSRDGGPIGPYDRVVPRTADPAARDRILDTAAPLFYTRGIRAVGMAEIVAAAGCGKNVLYRHFPSKDDLVLAYLRRAAAPIDASMDAAVAGLDAVPRAALVALVREVADRVTARGYRGCPFRNYLREMRDPTDVRGRFAMAEIRGLRHRVDRLVAELDVDEPGLLADRIWLLVEGLYASAPYGDRTEAATTAVGLVQELLAAA